MIEIHTERIITQSIVQTGFIVWIDIEDGVKKKQTRIDVCNVPYYMIRSVSKYTRDLIKYINSKHLKDNEFLIYEIDTGPNWDSYTILMQARD